MASQTPTYHCTDCHNMVAFGGGRHECEPCGCFRGMTVENHVPGCHNDQRPDLADWPEAMREYVAYQRRAALAAA